MISSDIKFKFYSKSLESALLVFNRSIDQLIYYFFVGSLLIDTLTGIMLRKDLPSIGQPVRFIIFYLIMYRVITLSFKNFIPLFIYYISFVSIVFIHFFSNQNLEWFIIDLAIVHKFLIIVSIWIYVHLLLQKCMITKRRLMFVFWFNLLVLSINLIFGIIGFGYYQYAGGIGSVGFFFAGNEVSGAMICIFFPILLSAYFNMSRKKYLIVSLLVLFLALIKVTKVAIVGTVVLVFMIPMINMWRRYSFLSLKFIKYILLGISLFLGILIFGYKAIDKIGLLGRIEYAYYTLHSGNILSVILSGRDLFLVDSLKAFLNDYSLIELLFGCGKNGSMVMMSQYSGEGKVVEIDFFDFLFQFGFVGLSLLLIIVFSMLRNSYKAYKKTLSSFPLSLFFVNLLLLSISLGAGHIYNSAMAGIFIGILNGMAYMRFEQIN